jgi:hypothetical protein
MLLCVLNPDLALMPTVAEPPKNEGFVSQDYIRGFLVKREYTNTLQEAYNTIDMKFK